MKLACQRWSNQIGDALNEQQQAIGIREFLQSNQFDQNNTCEGVISGNEQSEEARQSCKGLKMKQKN